MATAVVTARPSQALRQRREPQRPGLARVSTRATTVEASEVMPSVDPAEFGELSFGICTVPYCSLLTVERVVLTEDYILKKFNGNPPSLILHLHKTHFRFDQQDGNFSYNSEMRSFIEHLKNRTVPHEILEELFASGVKFYDGRSNPLSIRGTQYERAASTPRTAVFDQPLDSLPLRSAWVGVGLEAAETGKLTGLRWHCSLRGS
jgi:hypothetical protein